LKQLLKNVNILKITDNTCTIQKTDILIQDNLVLKTGSCDFLSDAETKDMTGRLLLPAMFNMHCHLGENMFAHIGGNDWNLLKYLDYTEKFHQQHTQTETQQQWKQSAANTICENLKNGVFGFCAARSAEPAFQFGMDTMAGYPIMQSEKLKHYTASGMNGFLEYVRRWNTERCSVGIFLHSLYTNTEETLSLVEQMMQQAEFLTVHISEDAASRKKEQEQFGISPVEVLQKYHLLKKNTILVHGGLLSERELYAIAESSALLAVCPVSNLFLHTRIPDIYQLNRLGIPWCIGTDGLGTGRTFSMFQQALCLKDIYPQLTFQELFCTMTVVPARFYPRCHYTGKIESGTVSHWLVLNENRTDAEAVLKDVFTGKINYSLFIGGEQYVYST